MGLIPELICVSVFVRSDPDMFTKQIRNLKQILS